MSMGMGAIGGPPAGMNMNMNGGAPPPRGAPSSNDKTLLNTYIYDYFLKNGYIECARSLINEADISTTPNSQRNSPSRRAQKHDSDGNAVNGDDNAMDTGEGPSQRKNEDPDDPNKDRADGLPLPKLPANCPQGSFLFDWWCLFWDIFGARNGVGKSSIAAGSYVTQTQATQRFRQEQLLRQMNPQQQHALMTGQVPSQLMNLGNQQYRNQMMQMQSGVLPNGAMNQDSAGGGEMSMQNKNLLARTAMMNNNRKTPLQIAGLKTQQHMMVQAAMQRESGEINDMNGQQPRPQSPAAGHNAGSPKRMRLENGQYQEVGNGRGAPQGTPQSAASASQAHQLLMANGIDPNRLTPQQFQAFQGQNPITQQKSIQLYAQNLAAHAGRAVTALQGGPPKGMANAQQNPPHGAPMMPQTSEGAPLGMSDFYATTPGGMRAGGMGAGTGNHALQDYQMQLMLLEQQNKKRLAMARAEQDSIAHHSDGQRRMEQGFSQSMSPNSRAAPSPQTPGNPKMTGTPKMPNQGGPGSPMPEGPMPGHVQQRNSPAAMGFNGQLQQGGQQDMMYNEMKNSLGIMGNANPGGAPNGGTMMRPPSSHPGFAAQMSQVEMNQMNANLRAQAGRGVPVGNVWQQTQQQQQQLQMQQQAQVAAQQQAAQQAQQQAAQQAQQQQQQQQQQAQQQAQQQQAGGPQSGQPQAQIGTPQPARQNLPHQTMPPPPSVPPGAPTNARTQPSSPQVAVQQPPTPTQSHKANPKGKAGREAGKKQRPNKKNGGAAPQPTGPVGTPSSEPPTPTTPQHQNSFSQNPRPVSFAPGQNVAGQPPQQPTPNPAHAAPPAPVPGPADVGAGFLGGEGDINLDFAGFPGDPSDNLLDTFDFDSFLNTEDTNGSIGYDGIGGWSNDTVEASAGES